jgi:hypothetical protein
MTGRSASCGRCVVLVTPIVICFLIEILLGKTSAVSVVQASSTTTSSTTASSRTTCFTSRGIVTNWSITVVGSTSITVGWDGVRIELKFIERLRLCSSDVPRSLPVKLPRRPPRPPRSAPAGGAAARAAPGATSGALRLEERPNGLSATLVGGSGSLSESSSWSFPDRN